MVRERRVSFVPGMLYESFIARTRFPLQKACLCTSDLTFNGADDALIALR